MSPTPARRCAIYLRVSLDRTGEQLAVDRQRVDCLAIVEQRGWQVHREYVDNSVSASDARKHRPAYDAMVRDYDAGRFDALVCWDLDRLTRIPRQLEDWIDAATDRGLLLVTANGEADLSTDGGRLFARIKASVARGEVERKGARQTRALRQRAENGRAPAGVRLTGYTAAGNVHQREAAIVRELFERFLQGDSLRALADDLERRGVRTRSGNSWNPSTIRTVLTNARYAGWSVYRGEIVTRDGERVRGSWDPLVSEGTYDAVQVRLQDPNRQTNRVGTHRRHIGSGIYRCAECDRRLRSHSGNRYRCPDGHLVRSMGVVDEFVLTALRGRLAMPDLRDLLPSAADAEGRALSAEIEELRRRLAAVEHDYDEALIDGRRYAEASRKISCRLDELQTQRAQLSAGLAAGKILAGPDPVAAFDHATLGAQREALDALMLVRLHPGRHGSRTFDPASVQITWRTA